MTATSLTYPTVRPGRQLGQRIVLLILLANAVLSAAAAGVQLYLSYQRDRGTVIDSIGAIDQGFRNSFENALWEFNFTLVDALLDGVYNNIDVEFIELKTETGERWTRGVNSGPNLILETLTFSHIGNDNTPKAVGSMTIGLTLANVQSRIWAQFWTLMLSNFAKTVVASLIMLAIFNHFVSRHLKRIAAHVAGTSWLSRSDGLELDRKEPDSPDDLSHIVQAVNEAKRNSIESFSRLNTEVVQRRATERTLAKKAVDLNQMNELLLQTNREQAEFTYAISHDLKSPTNTVQMLLDELSLSHGRDLGDDGMDIIGSAQQTIERMGHLVEDVLGYSRTIEEEFTPEPVDLNDMLQEIVSDLRQAISAAKANLHIADLPQVTGSNVQLRILFQNLLSNAIKFHSATRVPEIEVKREPDRDDGLLRISVSDNGIGIAPEHHDRIFGLFQRLHSHDEYQGTGLGLTLCKRIASNHKGRIELVSSPDEGTTFTVSLGK